LVQSVEQAEVPGVAGVQELQNKEEKFNFSSENLERAA
jgi:hypothetical protein